MQDDLTFGLPIVFIMTLIAMRTQLRTMHIIVTPRTTSLRKHSYVAPVVMATEALCETVSTD